MSTEVADRGEISGRRSKRRSNVARSLGSSQAAPATSVKRRVGIKRQVGRLPCPVLEPFQGEVRR